MMDRIRYAEGMREILGFPNPVNEKAARVVAGVVVAVSLLILATGWLWLLVPIAYGFWARVLTGPKLSPLGWLAQKRVAPRLGPPRHVPGPPKRFAQGIGAVLTTAAAVLGLAAGATGVAYGIVAAMVVAAGLESIFAVCLGYQAFAVLMRVGIVPERVCEECADIWTRRAAT